MYHYLHLSKYSILSNNFTLEPQGFGPKLETLGNLLVYNNICFIKIDDSTMFHWKEYFYLSDKWLNHLRSHRNLFT
jgi:hypothetical protein